MYLEVRSIDINLRKKIVRITNTSI